MDHIEIEGVYVKAKMGASISDAVREAAIMALEDHEKVTLEHNDETYDIEPDEIFEGIYEKNL